MSFRAVEKNGSFGFAKGRLVCRAKPNVPFVLWAKIELKKSAVGKNKKYRRVGKECRLNCFPISMWSVCSWLLVKMVYFFLLIVGLSMVVVSSFKLAPNICINATHFVYTL